MTKQSVSVLRSFALIIGALLLWVGVVVAGGNESGKILEQAVTLYNKQEIVKAYDLVIPLAEAGDPDAQAFIGSLCFHEFDNNKYYNEDKGFEWLRKSAEAGSLFGQFKLGIRLTTLKSSLDPGPRKEALKKEAVKWLLASAEQGHAYAQMEIAKIYHFSLLGVKRDYSKAVLWYQLASNRFKKEQEPLQDLVTTDKGMAETFIDRIVKAGKLTQDELKHALKQAEEWEKAHPNAEKTWPIYYDR